MKHKIPLIVVLIAIILGGVLLTINKTRTDSVTPVVQENITNPKDATYIIDGQQVALHNGMSTVPAAPGSGSTITTTYLGNEVAHDFDGDGRVDTAFILTQNSGGSGTFYYVAAALNKENGYIGTTAVLLGDRIEVQNVEMGKGNIVIVNYKGRKGSESFAAIPTVAKTMSLLLDPKTMQFGEVAKDFEGEADPSRMTLGMKSWTWVRTMYNDGQEIQPRLKEKFVLTFKNDKTFLATTDCNGVGGEYIAKGNSITFDKMISTMMFCEGSQEGDFSTGLSTVSSYHFTSKGELVFDLKFDSGSIIFK